LTVLLVLGLISFLSPEEGWMIGDKNFYFPTVEEMVNEEPEHIVAASRRMMEIEESFRIQQQKDSIAYADSLSFYLSFFKSNPSRIELPGNNPNYFHELFASFDSCVSRNELIHVLHYGDSQIEGDRITGTIRQKLQETFGGNGPGLLPAVQLIPSASVGQTSSENITRYTVSGSHQNRASHRRYGVLGQLGVTEGESYISFATRNWKDTYENVKTFDCIRLFVGRTSSGFKADIILPDKTILRGKPQTINSSLTVYSWKPENPVKKFDLRMSGSGEIYGIATDGNAGIALSNIPYRGSSGTFYTSMDSLLLASMYKELNTRLILLEFGGNVVPYAETEKSIADYKDNISRQLAFLRNVCPEAKIVFIGPADMSTKLRGKLQTYPHLEQLIAALKEAALDNGVAFWNMYEVMGGKDSMISWVKNSPALAAPDYIHFSGRGAIRMGELFFDSFMIYYDYYKFDREHPRKQRR
jgi:lysophospholipase L1-like esterase